MTSLHVEQRGNGPNLVLLHPVGLDGSSWCGVVDQLAADYRCTALDLPGHGASPLEKVGGTLGSYADAVIATLAQLGLSRYALAGLSFGGMIAQTIAVRRPPSLAALVVCGCGATFPDSIRPGILDRGLKVLGEGMVSTVDETMARWFSADFVAAGGAESVRQQLLTEDVESWANAWTAISQLDTKPSLGQVTAPTLCVAGRADLGSPPAMVRDVAAAIPGAGYVELDAPHMMHLEQPAALADIIRTFLRSAFEQ